MEIIASYQVESHQLIIDVVDEGVGIRENEKREVFKKFTRCKSNILMNPNGIGLGLYICKQIMSHLGGEISFDSKNNGTTFTVKYPILTNSEVLRQPSNQGKRFFDKSRTDLSGDSSDSRIIFASNQD